MTVFIPTKLSSHHFFQIEVATPDDLAVSAVHRCIKSPNTFTFRTVSQIFQLDWIAQTTPDNL